jgi:hypothetical protein
MMTCVCKNLTSNFSDGASSFQGVEQAGTGSSGCSVTSLSLTRGRRGPNHRQAAARRARVVG